MNGCSNPIGRVVTRVTLYLIILLTLIHCILNSFAVVIMKHVLGWIEENYEWSSYCGILVSVIWYAKFLISWRFITFYDCILVNGLFPAWQYTTGESHSIGGNSPKKCFENIDTTYKIWKTSLKKIKFHCFK